jgi:DNA-binding LytR/AlgR family response regulator
VLRALLIDDETSARADLRGKLAAHEGVTVVGEAATFRAARALLASADYDLVFFDVQLIGGESFGLVPDVRAGASFVFATAYDRYAARAFESHALDYLIKPIDCARLAEALRRAQEVHAADVKPPPREVPAAPAADRPSNERGEMCEVSLVGDERVYLRQCLEAWEDSLPADHVLRVRSGRFPRTVCYEREREPTRIYLAENSMSRVRRWWRAMRARLVS